MKLDFLYLGIIAIAFFLAGMALAFATMVNARLEETVRMRAVNEFTMFNRFGTIVSTDETQQFIVVRIRTTRENAEENVRIYISPDTRIMRSDPIFLEDTVIGFTARTPLSIRNLVAGTAVRIRVRGRPDGTLGADEILVGEPFPHI